MAIRRLMDATMTVRPAEPVRRGHGRERGSGANSLMLDELQRAGPGPLAA